MQPGMLPGLAHSSSVVHPTPQWRTSRRCSIPVVFGSTLDGVCVQSCPSCWVKLCAGRHTCIKRGGGVWWLAAWASAPGIIVSRTCQCGTLYLRTTVHRLVMSDFLRVTTCTTHAAGMGHSVCHSPTRHQVLHLPVCHAREEGSRLLQAVGISCSQRGCQLSCQHNVSQLPVRPAPTQQADQVIAPASQLPHR